MEKYMTPNILKVRVLDNYLLEITFETKEVKLYNMENLIRENKFYSNLKNIKYFNNVKPRGDTIEWANGEDVCPEDLYYNSKKIK